MNLTPENVALIAVGIALFFWPQISPFFKGLFGKQGAAGQVIAGPSPAIGRSDAVTELLKLQDTARTLGKPKAADLIGSAIVEIVTDATGAKK